MAVILEKFAAQISPRPTRFPHFTQLEKLHEAALRSRPSSRQCSLLYRQLHIAVYEGFLEVVYSILRMVPHPCFLDIRNDYKQVSTPEVIDQGQIEPILIQVHVFC